MGLCVCAAFWPVSANSQTETDGLAQASVRQTSVPLFFKDFFRLPVGPGELEFTPQLLNTHGKLVRITGYMVQQETGGTTGQFLLAPRPVQMSEHADGDADDLPPATVLVKLSVSQATWLIPHTAGLIELEGILSVGRQEASDGRVSWVQLQLAPQALKMTSERESENPQLAFRHKD